MFRTVELTTFVLLVNIFAIQSVAGTRVTITPERNGIENSPVLKELLQEQIEKFRQAMPCGFPQFRIPPLAPLVWEQLRLDTGDSFWIRLDGDLENGTTIGLNQFNLTRLNLQILKLQMDFEVLFPAVQTVGKYNAKGKLVGFLPFNRLGNFLLQLHGTIRFNIVARHLVVREMKIAPRVRSSVAHFENIFPTHWANSLFDRTMSDLIPRYMQENRQSIAAKIEATLKPKFNAVLQKYDTKEVLYRISQKDFKYANCRVV